MEINQMNLNLYNSQKQTCESEEEVVSLSQKISYLNSLSTEKRSSRNLFERKEKKKAKKKLNSIDALNEKFKVKANKKATFTQS